MPIKIFKKKKLSIGEQARIARRLATLLGAGISLLDAVALMRQPLFGRIIESISKGQLCSDAFLETGCFDRSLIDMLRIGEQSGSLEDALARGAAFLESREDISRKIIGAMMYPAFVACATLGIAAFLVMYIFPKILPLVTSMDIPLPFMTRVLMVLSYILIHFWMLIGILLTAGIFSFIFAWRRSRKFRLHIRRFLFRIPFTGGILRSSVLIEIFRSLGLLLQHGQSVPRALHSISGTLRHEEYKSALSEAADLITRGESFSDSFKANKLKGRNSRLFPDIVSDFIEMGERTGGAASSCASIASVFEAEVNESIKRISHIIEPALMLFMGLTVGSIALSIIMPIYEITGHLSK